MNAYLYVFIAAAWILILLVAMMIYSRIFDKDVKRPKPSPILDKLFSSFTVILLVLIATAFFLKDCNKTRSTEEMLLRIRRK